MPKRKKNDDIDYLSKKIKKFERKLKRAKRRLSETDSSSSDSPSSPIVDDTSVLDILDGSQIESGPILTEPEANSTEPETNVLSTDINQTPTETISPEEQVVNNDELEIADILGIDPTQTETFGKNIHDGLALRLEHIATNGLSKELRKDLNSKYLIPGNCTKIGSPAMNPEIKAAITEVVIKRDKGLEARQKQIAVAISGLAAVLSQELASKQKDNDRLKHLMDICRILCDIQHSESVTRRNFAIFSIKKDLKEHIATSKIDKYLFGENLADVLKTAKAVTKSGSDLKTKVPVKPKPISQPAANLNWKSPAPARKATMMAPTRGREPAVQRPAPGNQTRQNRNATRFDSSRPSHLQSKPNLRR